MDKKKDPGIWAVTKGPFQQSDGELLESGMLADAEVKCAERTWKEGQTGKVTITEFEPADVDCLLQFIYTGSIDLPYSYPRETTWPALIKIWKTADFFCLDMLRDLVIEAAKRCSRGMALEFCAFDPPDGHDQKMIDLFGKDFVPAVKAIYDEEVESARDHFVPIILTLAVVSVHSFSKMEGFEKLLKDIPLFSADWATALMKNLPRPEWGPQFPAPDRCYACDRFLDHSGVLKTVKYMRQLLIEPVCTRCYKIPNLVIWNNTAGSNKSRDS